MNAKKEISRPHHARYEYFVGLHAMSRYPDEATRRFDQQFAETPDERNERRRETMRQRLIVTLYRLIADLSPSLTDEGDNLSQEGLDSLRRRVANALPPAYCPDWLTKYRDPQVISSGLNLQQPEGERQGGTR